jgi:glycosyltransferase involved in cell wall biosynthesis
MTDLAIVTTGFLPIPATRGGAVEALIVNFLDKNEEYEKLNITVFSTYDEQAKEQAKKYKKTNFIFVKPNKIVQILDLIVYFLAKHTLKGRAFSFRYIFQRTHFLNKISVNLSKNDYQTLLFENHPTMLSVLKKRNNYAKYKGRYFYHTHNEIKGTFGCFDLLKNSSSVICISQFIANQAVDLLGNEASISILKNCIDLSKFANKYTKEEIQHLKAKYGISETEKVLLFTGRFVKEKGIKELALALREIKYENYKLLIVGSLFFGIKVKSDFEKEIAEIVEPVKDKVIFTGFVPYEKMPDLYAIADIAVLPSMWEEPAGLTIIEAMASGLPIITTRSGGIPEYANEKCAFILKRDENLISNIAKSIDTLLSDENLAEKMGKESRLTVQELNLDNYYFNLLSLLGK